MAEIFGEKMCAVIIHIETVHMGERNQRRGIYPNARCLINSWINRIKNARNVSRLVRKRGRKVSNYKPLTPKFRSDILDSINSQVSELNACQENVFVSAQRVGLDALQNLIKALPDGYPIPHKEGDK